MLQFFRSVFAGRPLGQLRALPLSLFYKTVTVQYMNKTAQATRTLPRVKFVWGVRPHSFDVKEVGLYWGLVNPLTEGFDVYKHHFLFYYRPRFSWR